MMIALPERSKKAGVCYAVTNDGTELPVIDVTHPAFALVVSQEELDRQLQAQLRETEQRSRVPHFIQNWMLGFMLKRSRIMRALMNAESNFLGGMDTYLLKLGPGNMGRGYTSSIDRQISASLPGLSMRLRLQNLAHLLADALAPQLQRVPAAPVHLLSIGGGPAMDCLNGLIVLQKEHPGFLASRPISVRTLDLDEAGPHFGARALEALRSGDGPLAGLDIGFLHVRYDWTNTAQLAELLGSLADDRAIVAASSEGALFEYANDEIVTANLRTLYEGMPPDGVVTGTVTRADTTGRLLNTTSRIRLQMRGLEGFTALAAQSGWKVARSIDRPSGHDVCLEKK